MKTAKSTSTFECNCGKTIAIDTELHICECGIVMCPNCFDFINNKNDDYQCEDCQSKG